MAQWILEWDVDAQILSDLEKFNPKRLSSKNLVRSQVLARSLALKSPDESLQKFLPQTYASASILLTLLPPQQIVALPKGLRNQTLMYPRDWTDQIPLDTDRTHAEILYRAHPDKAFVSAQYSHPSTLQALRNQGIPLVTLGPLTTLDEIQSVILQIGQCVTRSQEAELLTLFMQAAFNALHNRLWAQKQDLPQRIVFLHYYDQFYTPSAQCLSTQLLKILNLNTLELPPNKILERENLLQCNSDCILIAAPQPNSLKVSLKGDLALQNLRVKFLDDDIQQTPTHYVVLACYDLVEALLENP